MITYIATKILCLANTKYMTNNLTNSIDNSIINEGISAILIISVFDEFIIFPIDIFSVLQSVWHSQPVYLQSHEGSCHTMIWNFDYVQ